MEGCFCVYVVKTTDALVLFFKQRNLQKETEHSKLKGREVVLHGEIKREAKCSTSSISFVHRNHLWLKLTAKTNW